MPGRRYVPKSKYALKKTHVYIVLQLVLILLTVCSCDSSAFIPNALASVSQYLSQDNGGLVVASFKASALSIIAIPANECMYNTSAVRAESKEN